ncbi:MAG: hypothetical protein IJ479_03375 [Alphaproteobacteria bacterium]|nr:hypothetical protein [Alphaproteobacteria bacterium]
MYVINEQTKIVNIWADTDKNRKRLASGKYDVVEYTGEVEQGYDGFLYAKGYAPAPTYEEVEAIRAGLYRNQVDPLMAEYNRKKTFNLFEEGEEEALLAEIEAKVAEIKENNPYPVVEVIIPEANETAENEESAAIGKGDLRVEEEIED